MDDQISRQAAIDALRYAQHRFTVADEAGGIGTVKWSEDVIYFAAAENVLNDLPSAQSEIVRCGQCKYAEVADAQDNQDGYICQFHRGSIWFSGSYCSWGERRTDD